MTIPTRFTAPGALAALALLIAPRIQAETKPADQVTEEQRFLEEQCGSCHPSERMFLIRLNHELRRHVVLRMRERREAGDKWLSDEEIERVLADVDERAPSGEAVQPKSAESRKALFRRRCSGCHEPDRVYGQVKSERENPSAWLHVVTRMQALNPNWISEDEARQIVDYLRTRTQPQAAR